MRLSIYISSIMLFCAFVLTACAGGRQVRGTAAPARLLESYSERILPGRPEGEPVTNYSFYMVWQSEATPGDFFWKGKDSWMVCNVARATAAQVAAEDKYRSVPYEPGEYVKKGDTIVLVPMKGGKYAMPEGAEEKDNVIVFKTNNQWHYLEVRDFTRKPDVAMP